MRRYVPAALAVTVAVLVGVTACSRDQPVTEVYYTMDANNDGRVSASEFQHYYVESQLFERWDQDGDGRLTEDELRAGLFDYLDANDDGQLGNADTDPNSSLVDDRWDA